MCSLLLEFKCAILEITMDGTLLINKINKSTLVWYFNIIVWVYDWYLFGWCWRGMLFRARELRCGYMRCILKHYRLLAVSNLWLYFFLIDCSVSSALNVYISNLFTLVVIDLHFFWYFTILNHYFAFPNEFCAFLEDTDFELFLIFAMREIMLVNKY